MPRRTHGGALGVPGRPDGDWLPRPRKDMDYDYVDLRDTADRIRRRIDLPEGPGRRPFREANWPKRRPALSQAQIGDIFAGNIALRATCACGHSAPVDPLIVAAKFAITTRIIDIQRRARCTQCRRYGRLSVTWPEGR